MASPFPSGNRTAPAIPFVPLPGLPSVFVPDGSPDNCFIDYAAQGAGYSFVYHRSWVVFTCLNSREQSLMLTVESLFVFAHFSA